MFFIGGISPKTTVVDPTPRLCPVCGLAQARIKRVDHYLNLFFVPILRVKKGEPFLMCDRCERGVQEMGPEYQEIIERMDTRCDACGRALHPEFKFCPYCGRKV